MNLALPLPLPAPLPAPAARLRPSLVPPRPPTPASRKARRRQIWLALHFPDWPLIAATSSLPAEERAQLSALPTAVTDVDRQRHVMACNDVAVKQGVRVGHSLNAAMAMCPELNALPRDIRKEQSLLKSLAERCLQYSPVVSTADPDELLLEIRGSLRLFGGLQALMARIRSDLVGEALTVHMTAGPTPESALWLARASSREVVKPLEVRSQLDKLPIAVLRWPTDVELRLWRFGTRTLGDLLRLPRGGLAKRIGANLLTELDRALGRCSSLRRSVVETERFHDTVRLDYEIATTAQLEPLLRSSLQRLATFLTKRQLTVGEFRIALRHREQRSTPIRIALARPTSDVGHMCDLLHEKLHSLVLTAAVSELCVTAEQLLRAQPADRSLFCADDRQPQQLAERKARLYEQLVGRLGEQGIARLKAAADHRPEHAQRTVCAMGDVRKSSTAPPPELPRRPRWLLSVPKPITKSQLRNKAKVLKGPESIEAGWWDGDQIQRDYFVVQSRRGSLCWIFRDRKQQEQWYLHGLFG